ncbi:MAG: NAD(P)/FAD-dependent oxidoreductase [Bacteroidetes bacterium]|nr:NAD(P)/FAD-dependent oxidoreductase [Bacteroidota bacterium]MDA1121655.1 NAD(P)/FAD-dependent oxidoreductase [Bacteroidota bacterium]
MKGKIIICGAGLVGSLLSIILRKRGYTVDIHEKRDDLRRGNIGGGRSINLALSNRGLNALDIIGLKEIALQLVVPMHGRMIHQPNGDCELQRYGDEGQVINSISREKLNKLLLNEAEKQGVSIHFNSKIESCNLTSTDLNTSNQEGKQSADNADIIIGADGAFSAIRQSMEGYGKVATTKEDLGHSYKELTIGAKIDDFAIYPNALHIWPRHHLMLIALPNIDKTFTCTLFLPNTGADSFESFSKSGSILNFFEQHFSDVPPLISDLIDQFNQNPTCSLSTIKTYPWKAGDFLLIGDAAHAIVPFYGQGMNAGFEDCFVLNQLLDQKDDNWQEVMPLFQESRKKNTDAIATLALQNFIEMRDKVADPDFVRRKALEKELHKQFGNRWLPLYSMVTFSDMPYSEALERGKVQDEILTNFNTDKIGFTEILNLYEHRCSELKL